MSLVVFSTWASMPNFMSLLNPSWAVGWGLVLNGGRDTSSNSSKPVICTLPHQLSNRYLQKYGMNSFTQDYLVWHHFGYKTMEENLDLVNFYRDTLMKSVQPYNLALLVESYVWRSDLGLDRDGGMLELPAYCISSVVVHLTAVVYVVQCVKNIIVASNCYKWCVKNSAMGQMQFMIYC